MTAVEPDIFQLLGSMLGAGYQYIHGLARILRIDEQTATEQRFWGHRSWFRVDRSDRIQQIDGPAGHRTAYRGRVLEQSPVIRGGISPECRMLVTPRLAFIWGRPGDDYRFTGELEHLSGGRARLGLVHQEDPSCHGTAEVDIESGRLLALERPGSIWELIDVDTSAFSTSVFDVKRPSRCADRSG